jgi:hypothetical protein
MPDASVITETRLADMEDRRGQLDVSEVTGALLHVLVARCALEATVDGAHARVTKAIFARELLGFVL